MRRLFIVLGVLLMFVTTLSAQDNNPLRGEDRILVWIADAVAPANVNSNNPGQIALMDGTGAIEPLLDLPIGTDRVLPCTTQPTSPDGNHFAFYYGTDIGVLNLVTGTETFIPIDTDFHAMGCVGNGTFQYTPNSKFIGYIDFPPGANQEDVAEGTLHLVNTTTYATEQSFEDVFSFFLQDSQVHFVTLIGNSTGNKTEAAIVEWDGQVDREIATLVSNEGCKFISSNIRAYLEDKYVVAMVQRCSNVRRPRIWQLYIVDANNRSATLTLEGEPVGQYFSFSRTNALYAAPNSPVVFMTIPDGLINVTVDVLLTDPDNGVANTQVDSYAIMPRFSNTPYAYDNNHPPVLSTKGNFLALSRSDPNNVVSVYLLDMNSPELSLDFPEPDRGNRVSEILFSQDSRQVIYVAGGSGGNSNSVFGINLETGNNFRIRRGRYGQGVISPDGEKLALMNWQLFGANPVYLSLVILDIESTAENLIFEGAEIIDDEPKNLRFAYPLMWLQVDEE